MLMYALPILKVHFKNTSNTCKLCNTFVLESNELSNLMFKKFYILPRVLSDYRSKLGEEYILSAFPFETDKYRAMQILQTVSAWNESKTIFFCFFHQLWVFSP